MLFEFKGKQKRFYNFKEKWTHQWWEDMLLWSLNLITQENNMYVIS